MRYSARLPPPLSTTTHTEATDGLLVFVTAKEKHLEALKGVREK